MSRWKNDRMNYRDPSTGQATVRDLRRFLHRISTLRRKANHALASFWDQDKGTFGDSADGNFRVSQSCFILHYCRSNYDAEPRLIQEIERLGGTNDALDGIRKRIRATDFPVTTSGLDNFNIFSAAILGATCQAEEIPLDSNPTLKNLSAAIEKCLESSGNGGVRWEPTNGSPWSASGFLTYWTLRSLGQDSKHQLNISRMLDWLEGELYRQIVLVESSQSEVADVMQLGFCAAACLRFGKSLSKATMSRVWSAIFKHQSDNGIWLRGDPILPIPVIGTVYSFAPEMLAVLLGESRKHWDDLEEYHESFARLCEWLDTNYRDGDIKGWRSNHIPPGSAECWSTATVAWLLANLYQLNSYWLTTRARVEFEREVRDQGALSRVWDSNVPLRNLDTGSLKELVERYILIPARKSPPEPRSVLLFGPPGTAKTSYARAIAGALDWPFLVITVGDFLTLGSDSVARRAREIFELIEYSERLVVLFDEIEELVRKRTDPLADRESRLLTTALLPYFQGLRDVGRNIFVATTNQLNAVDEAAIRLGRFDIVLGVGPPTFEEKSGNLLERLSSRLDWNGVQILLEARKAEIGWATFQEWSQFVNAIEDVFDLDAVSSALTEMLNNLAISEKDRKEFQKIPARLP